MSSEFSLLLYENRRSVFPIYIIEYFSVINSLKSIFFLLNVYFSEKLPKKFFLTTRLIPFQRYSFVQSLNRSLLLYFARNVFKRLPKYHVVWINDPNFYPLFNFLRWDFLVFDYADLSELKHFHFYKQVFSKGLVFVYFLGRFGDRSRLFYLYKDKDLRYQIKIWDYIEASQKEKM